MVSRSGHRLQWAVNWPRGEATFLIKHFYFLDIYTNHITLPQSIASTVESTHLRFEIIHPSGGQSTYSSKMLQTNIGRERFSDLTTGRVPNMATRASRPTSRLIPDYYNPATYSSAKRPPQGPPSPSYASAKR